MLLASLFLHPFAPCSGMLLIFSHQGRQSHPSQSFLQVVVNKEKKGCSPDIRPIAVGESLRRLTGKYLCSVLKDKASKYFEPLQLGVACSQAQRGSSMAWESAWRNTGWKTTLLLQKLTCETHSTLCQLNLYQAGLLSRITNWAICTLLVALYR